MTIIDPPGGWKYGFPKPIPEERKKDVQVWLVEQGYPKKEIDSFGEHFYCRYWEQLEKSQVDEAGKLTPYGKAEELVRYFQDFTPPKLSDYSKIYSPTAKMFALKVCDEVLGYMGADRGTEFWTDVKQEIENM